MQITHVSRDNNKLVQLQVLGLLFPQQKQDSKTFRWQNFDGR